MRGSVPMSSPQTPGSPSSGENAAMVVSTPNDAGKRTCRTPRIAASAAPVRPVAMCRCTFSPTTMASSTTMPRVTMKPNMLIMFKVTPSPGISRKAPKNATGSPAAVQTATRVESVKKRTRKMSARPCRPFRTSTSMRLSKSRQASDQGVTVSPGGSRREVSPTCAWTAVTVASSRASGASITSRNTAGSPFIRAARWTSVKPSVTVAMSPRVTVAPSRALMSGIRANASAVPASASVRRRTSLTPVRTEPAGMSAEARRIAAAT